MEEENNKLTAERDDLTKRMKALDRRTYLFTMMILNIFGKKSRFNRMNCTVDFLSKHVPVPYMETDEDIDPLVFDGDATYGCPIIRAFKKFCPKREIFSRDYHSYATRLGELCQFRDGECGYFWAPEHKTCSLVIGDFVAEFTSRPRESDRFFNSLVLHFRPSNIADLKTNTERKYSHYGK